jgi:NADH dehydrogenase (ubiquinone) 1 alpha subcomplex subunit 10
LIFSKHGDLLVYDWSEGGEVETVVEDLEELNFEDLDDIRSDKYRDWKMSRIVLLEKRLE